MSGKVRTNLSTLALAGLCAALALLVWSQLEGDPRAQRARTELASIELAPPVSVEEPRLGFAPIDRYEEIVRRPLFNETRRPQADASQALAADAPSGRDDASAALSLSGIAITPQKTLALIEDARHGRVLRLELGASVGGWRLERIDADRVTLRHDDTRRELVLYEHEEPTARGQGGRRPSGARPPKRTSSRK